MALASDSAGTVYTQEGALSFEKTNKMFNLRKGEPLGAISWGLGNLGWHSLATVTKDFREELPDLIDLEDYEVEEVANRYTEYLKERYDAAYGGLDDGDKPPLGFVVCGYSTDEGFPEGYETNIGEGSIDGPTQIWDPQDTGLMWHGQVEPLTRLINGFSNRLPDILENEAGLSDPEIGSVLKELREGSTNLVFPTMPIQDAIDLSKFLADVVRQYSKFTAGPQTVGGPLEVAAITKHEQFKWVERKHYYPSDLNPEG